MRNKEVLKLVIAPFLIIVVGCILIVWGSHGFSFEQTKLAFTQQENASPDQLSDNSESETCVMCNDSSKNTKEIKSEELVKKQVSFLDGLLEEQITPNFYLAAKASDIAKCDRSNMSTEDQQDCKENYKLHKFIKNSAEGKCSQVPSSYPDSLCNALSSQDCSSLGDTNSLMCQALLNGNIEKCIDFAKKSDLTLQNRKLSCRRYVNFYKGYKENDPNVCQNIPKQKDYAGNWLCRGLVGGKPVLQGRMKNNMLRDMAYFILSRHAQKEKRCNKIQSEFIKQRCLNSNEDLHGLVNDMFYPTFGS